MCDMVEDTEEEWAKAAAQIKAGREWSISNTTPDPPPGLMAIIQSNELSNKQLREDFPELWEKSNIK